MMAEARLRPAGWHEYAVVDLPEAAAIQYRRVETEHPETGRLLLTGTTSCCLLPASHIWT